LKSATGDAYQEYPSNSPAKLKIRFADSKYIFLSLLIKYECSNKVFIMGNVFH